VKSENDYQAESDANTLKESEKIRADRKRLAAAQKKLNEDLKATQRASEKGGGWPKRKKQTSSAANAYKKRPKDEHD